MIYTGLIRPLLFRMDPETAHRWTVRLGSVLSGSPAASRLITRFFRTEYEPLGVSLWGLRFSNPVGLSAGFDKGGTLPQLIAALGFGFMEVGSVSFRRWPGNPSPNLLRLPEDQGLINRLGLNSEGADIVLRRLRGAHPGFPLGINLVKTADPEIAGKAAVEDYLSAFRRFYEVAQFITLNLSCPNTVEGKSFEDPQMLEPFLAALKKERDQSRLAPGIRVPVLVKLSPDLHDEQLGRTLEICRNYGIDGLVIANTTTRRKGLQSDPNRLQEFGFGGLSGRPLKPYVQQTVEKVFQWTEGSLPIVAVGGIGCDPGIHPAEEVWQYLKLGASLVEVYTGLIYRGPSLPNIINRELVRILRREGFSSLSQFLNQRNGKTGKG